MATLELRPSAAAIAARSRDLKIGSFSDIHLGHSQTPTPLIIKHLYEAFPDNAETGELDLLLMGGDLFDEALAYNSTYITEIENWMYSLARMCAKRKIVLRFLEGTSSHDRGQAVHMGRIIAQHGLEVDYKYITQVTVEYIESLDISMLYVPDNIAGDGDTVWAMVQKVLLEAGLDKVDYANIHGGFAYQLPKIASVQANCHQMERYLGIVSNYIFSGHIHIPSRYGRIFCNGSFDRLNHGEEEAKGHWRATIRQSGDDDLVFVENKHAAIYRSVSCEGMAPDQAREALDGMAHLPLDSSVRVIAERGNAILSNLAQLRQDYPHIRWVGKAVDSREKAEPLLLDLRPQQAIPEITPETIVPMLMERIRGKCDDAMVVTRCAELLPSFL